MKKLVRLRKKDASTLVFWRKRIYVRRKIKKALGKNSFKRLRAALKSKLNAKHVSQAINTWMVPAIRYSASITE